VGKIHRSAWRLVALSVLLQVLIFPLPNLYLLSWIALAPLLVALFHARVPDTLQLEELQTLIPATPWQGFWLAYVCGILWYLGTCYWVYDTMHQYGGLAAPLAAFVLLLFSFYLGLYHGAFGWVTAVLARRHSYRRALISAPFLWVALELVRTRVSGFPWDLLGVAQVDNIPLTRIATATCIFGLSFEIVLVNAAFAAAFLLPRHKRRNLLAASLAAAFILQAGRWLSPPPVPAELTAILLQQNLPVADSGAWTQDLFQTTLRDFASLSLHPTPTPNQHPDLILWPESPAPFYTSDPLFRNALSDLAHQAEAWVISGAIGTEGSSVAHPGIRAFNSAVLVSPSGDWEGRYDKIHLVPFGEYLPLPSIFGFAGGLTQAVGSFTRGSSHAPLAAANTKIGVFICYESIFPDEVRQLVAQGADVLVNISNDGWYGDSGAWAQHLNQARMRAVENHRWLLRDTNTGLTASIDPYGRVVAQVPRKTRTALAAPYAITNVTTFYARHGDWFAWLCAIIAVGVLFAHFALR